MEKSKDIRTQKEIIKEEIFKKHGTRKKSGKETTADRIHKAKTPIRATIRTAKINRTKK